MIRKKLLCAALLFSVLISVSSCYSVSLIKAQNDTSSAASGTSDISLKKNIPVKTGQNGYLPTQTKREVTENQLENTISDDNLCTLDWRDTDSFYYQALSDSEKIMYQQILTSITTRQSAKLMTDDEDIIDTVFNCVMANHPELYYVSGYQDSVYQSQSKDSVFVIFLSNYTYTEEDCQKGDNFISDYVNDCIDTVGKEMSDKEKTKIVYDYIITKTAYVIDPQDDQTILSIAANKKAVCAGYAKMFQYIMQSLHIDCYPVYGKVGDIDHMWDIVKIDDSWLHVDCTLGEPDELQWDGAESNNDNILYDCFCVSTTEILKSHSINNQNLLP